MPPRSVHTESFATELGTWTYSSAPPSPALRGVVRELWEVEGALMPFVEKILPNGFAEVMINLGPTHTVIDPQGRREYRKAWYSGLHRGAITIESLDGTHLVSARIYPEHARRLFGDAAPRAHDDVVELEMLLGSDADRLRSDVALAAGPSERFDLLEQFLERRLAGSPPLDPRLATALAAIRSNPGSVRIGGLSETVGVSRKHLSAIFLGQLGIGPKAVAGIERFAWVLGRLRESEAVDWSELAHMAGYSDQAHLVRDFTAIAGASPTTFLRVRTPDSRAVIVETG